MAWDGGCFCGALRFRLRAAPMFVYCCHCTDCQRQTGSAYVVNDQIETEMVELLSGEPQGYAMATESGYPHDIFRCPRCGCAVWSDHSRRGWLRFIRIATLDMPGVFRPEAHIYVRSKLSWVSLEDGIPAFDEYYDMPSLSRRTLPSRRKRTPNSRATSSPRKERPFKAKL